MVKETDRARIHIFLMGEIFKDAICSVANGYEGFLPTKTLIFSAVAVLELKLFFACL